jgi:hypothetical protein
VAAEQARPHQSVGLARCPLGVKSIPCCLGIPENIKNLENSYLFHFKSEKYK